MNLWRMDLAMTLQTDKDQRKMTEPERRCFFYLWSSLCQNCLLSKHQKKQGFQDLHPQLPGKETTLEGCLPGFKEEPNEGRAGRSKPSPSCQDHISLQCLFTHSANVNIYEIDATNSSRPASLAPPHSLCLLKPSKPSISDLCTWKPALEQANSLPCCKPNSQ